MDPRGSGPEGRRSRRVRAVEITVPMQCLSATSSWIKPGARTASSARSSQSSPIVRTRLSALRLGGIMTLAAGFALTGCNKKKMVEIRVKGSDTMVQLVQAWSETYQKVNPSVRLNLNGGGTGTGVAALENNQTDICDASREIKPEERAKVKEVTGKEAQEFVVAYDALAVYAHPSNPVKDISVEELREIWAEGGAITTWEQINPASKGTIALFGRQNNSGTY